MSENFEQSTNKELQEIVALEKMRNNELQKYVAAALDRLSTASAVVGILSPLIYMITTGVGLFSQVLMAGGITALSVGFHVCGRVILQNGLR